jgi:hypothetical protein
MKKIFKCFAFMTRNGELCEAYKVSILGDDTILEIPDWGIDDAPAHSYKLSVVPEAHDGWIVFHPDLASGMTLFFNNRCEQMFENLGEL